MFSLSSSSKTLKYYSESLKAISDFKEEKKDYDFKESSNIQRKYEADKLKNSNKKRSRKSRIQFAVLEGRFRCYICYELLVYPQICPDCSHNFCKRCVLRHNESLSSRNDSELDSLQESEVQYSCPHCRCNKYPVLNRAYDDEILRQAQSAEDSAELHSYYVRRKSMEDPPHKHVKERLHQNENKNLAKHYPNYFTFLINKWTSLLDDVQIVEIQLSEWVSSYHNWWKSHFQESL